MEVVGNMLETQTNLCKTEGGKTEYEDVTAHFLDAHKEIRVGELVCSSRFTLFEGMSAIELMDPKMDAGMVQRTQVPNTLQAQQLGILPVEDITNSELIATMDGLWATLASWLQGHPLPNTLLTNYYLLHPLSGLDPRMHCFAHGILQLAMFCYDTVNMAAVAEEEDFSGSTSELNQMQHVTTTELMNMLKAVDSQLQKQLRKQRASTESGAEQQITELCAIAARFTLLRQILGALHSLLPVVLSNKNSQPGVLTEADLDDTTRRLCVCVDTLQHIQHTLYLGTQPVDGQDGDFGWLPSFEPEVNRHLLPATFPRKTHICSRPEALIYFGQVVNQLLYMTRQLPLNTNNFTNALQFIRGFGREKENFVLTRSVLQLLFIPFIECTPQSQSSANQPGQSTKGSTSTASSQTSSPMKCSSPLLSAPDCYTSGRAKLLGGSVFAQCMTEAITGFVYVQPPAECSAVLGTWHVFIEQCCTVFMQLLTAAGNNQARQPEKLVGVFKQLAELHSFAEHTDKLMLAEQPPAPQSCCSSSNCDDNHTPPHKVLLLSQYVLYHILLTVHEYFQLAFNLRLFSTFEFSYIYWYLGEFVYRQLAHTVDLAVQHSVQAARNASEESQKGAAKKSKARQRKEQERMKAAHLRLRSELLHWQCHYRVCQALFHAVLGSERLCLLVVPRPEAVAVRYAHRLHVFAPLDCPPYFPYDQFIACSRMDHMLESPASSLLNYAADMFTEGRHIITNLQQMNQQSNQLEGLSTACKQNAVVCKLLASRTPDQLNIKLNFEFTDNSLVPTMKIQKL